MHYYVMGEITAKTFEWVPEYLSKINGFIEMHGGSVLSRSLNMERIEGTRSLPTNVILLEFPDKKAAHAFFDDPAYQSLRSRRREGSISEFVMFPSEDLANDINT